ncbi:hypothetical protein GYH30_017333 [Glycine max]|nr:hypothetical protein GYH30_017333 [Glycine max]
MYTLIHDIGQLDEIEIVGLVTMDVTKQDSIPHVSDSFGTSGPQSSFCLNGTLTLCNQKGNVVLFQNLAMLMHFSTRLFFGKMKVWDSLKLLLWAGKFYGVLFYFFLWKKRNKVVFNNAVPDRNCVFTA